jgi:hypothetical protein
LVVKKLLIRKISYLTENESSTNLKP